MKKTREEKAITLIALIITIVVLLILAVVAINAVTGDGIIQHATNAKTEYEKAQAEEESVLSYYGTYLENKGDVGPWKQEGNKIYMEGSDGKTIELQIGDKVNYIEPAENSKTYSISYTQNGGTSEDNSQILRTENLDWRVLGITSNGKVELISTTPTTATIYLYGEKGYLNAKTILNSASNALYATDKAIGRSLNLDDLDKLAGINSEKQKKELGTYGKKREYEYNTATNKAKYRESLDGGLTWGAWTDSLYSSFKEPGKKEMNTNNSTITANLTDTNYYYTITTEKINNTTKDNKSLANIITCGEKSENYISQWLATNIIYFSIKDTELGMVKFSVKALYGGTMAHQPLFTSNGNESAGTVPYSLRPVVTLNSNVELYDNNGVWEIKITP